MRQSILPFIFLFGINLYTQEIMFDALKDSRETCGRELTGKDSLAGSWSLVCQYYEAQWHVISDLRRLGEVRPVMYKDNDELFIKYHTELKARYSSEYYSLFKLPLVCDSQKVLVMGYYGSYFIKTKQSNRKDEEFIAIRLTESIRQDIDLKLQFKFIVEYGIVLDLLTNNLPQTQGAFFVDEIFVSIQESDKLIEFNMHYENNKKQIGHEWLIIKINDKKNSKNKFGPAVTIMAPDACSCEQKITTVKPKEYDKNKSYNLQFLFSTGSFEIIQYDSLELSEMINYLKNNPEKKIGFVGHTDNLGESEKNMTLSVDRAKSVYDLFYSMGIDSARMQYKGVGDSQPIASNETEEGRIQNRRVEIWIW